MGAHYRYSQAAPRDRDRHDGEISAHRRPEDARLASTPFVIPPQTEHVSSPDQSRWFAEEVHAHEASLRSYLHGSFPKIRDVDDVVQESYLRIWKARAAQPIQSARAFLFRVAQRVALDRVRRERTSPIETVRHLGGLSVVEEGPDAAEAVGRQERVKLLAEAIAGLPSRCREIFILHKIKGLSRQEVADQLRLSDRTVEVQTARAMKRCAEFLRRRGVTGMFEP
jgi:RNA polymerase sigma factor (sigma-70 family)